ncbi:glycine betaine ABC transporter substrate-binding protein [uncultured Corynebacterium sp.]|uniref:glycine betaine ABC transporter substrate-binding protein n=1 Tax=uncultured Corynebacterium sp. TaxID=159447 RepID=UPI0025FA6498|nr:glycine betaine ABC transporter substrate-binding protein [uncultured Corynebacterium sp.]
MALVGSVVATAGHIKALKLQVLTDPDQFFPKYNLASVIRTEVLDEHPEIEELFTPLAQLLTDERMQELSARVNVDGEDYTTVALDFLQDENLIPY